jgi:mannose-6-phosphate isomerase
MAQLPPLRFEPILREYLWGGRRLAELGKTLGDGDHYAESWEIVDHGADQSVVAGGSLAGTRLHDLVLQHGPALFGRQHPQRQFPLLFKFLDCQKTLSVQVHPNDAQAARLQPPDLGKTEAWVVLAAEPGAKVYSGLKPGVRRATLERGVTAGVCAQCLHHFEPQPGDCVFIEAGTVHALGAGLLIAEIQQASDTTFRLFDWNRVDQDGKHRPLHIRESLDTINYLRGQVGPQQPATTQRANVQQLVACDKFVLDRWFLDAKEDMTNDDRFHILAVVEGSTVVSGDGVATELQRGGTLLVPASCREIELRPQGRATMLDIYLP